jgi:hypothetical protein
MNYYIVHESGLVQRIGRFNGPAEAERAALRKFSHVAYSVLINETQAKHMLASLIAKEELR